MSPRRVFKFVSHCFVRLPLLLHSFAQHTQLSCLLLTTIFTGGKLEVEALENKGRAFKNEMQEWVEGAQGDLKTMHQRAIENIQKELRDVVATAEDVKMGLKKRVEDEVGTVVAGAKDCFEAWTRELKDGQCTEYGVDDNREVVKNGSEGSNVDLLNKENQKPSFGDSSKVISSPMMDSSSRLDCPSSSSLKSPGDEPVKDETIAKNAIEKDVGSVGYKFRKLFNDGWFDGEVVEIRPLASEFDLSLHFIASPFL